MHHEHHQWHSPHLGREMHVDVWGHAGARLIVFPTTMGTWREWPDRQMPTVLREHLDNGWLQMTCVDQVHDESWYGRHLHPGARAWRHLQYDAYVYHEVLPFTASINGNPFVIVTGASFGAYHAACFAFRHPEAVNRLIGMSGMYDITHMTGGYSDDNVYATNPYVFMQHESGPARLEAFKQQDIIFAIGRDDPSYGNNCEFSGILWGGGIGNALRIWDGHAHDWPWWERMIVTYAGGHD